MLNNIIIDTDSYMASHHLAFPQDMQASYFYFESRGGIYDELVFFGLQGILKEHFVGRVVDWKMADEANEFFTAHGEPFPLAGWRYIAEEYDGNLPVRIKAVREGSVISPHNVLFTIESTDERVAWLPAWLETQLVRTWFPITVASRSRFIKTIIYTALMKTSDDPDGQLPFKLHDFGSRGTSSRESAEIGGAAHLVNFMGSDTCAGVWYANKMYNTSMSGFSIPAASHATVTSWGRDHEVDAYRNMLDKFAKPGSLVAVVSDSYDVWNAVENIWSKQLKQQIIDSGATVVIRPDSGNPPDVVLRILKTLAESFGTTTNSKGYRVLNNTRVIQGDGVNAETIKQVLDVAADNGFSADNIAFGCGGYLLQDLNRDCIEAAMKLSAIKRNGVWQGVSKSPIGSAMKKSRAGKLSLVKLNGKYNTIQGPSDGDLLETVFENGGLMREQSLEEIRKLAWKH